MPATGPKHLVPKRSRSAGDKPYQLLDQAGTRNRTRTGITLRPHDRINRSAHTLGGFYDTQCARRFAIEDFAANVR
jgi:hypothetical protein